MKVELKEFRENLCEYLSCCQTDTIWITLKGEPYCQISCPNSEEERAEMRKAISELKEETDFHKQRLRLSLIIQSLRIA